MNETRFADDKTLVELTRLETENTRLRAALEKIASGEVVKRGYGFKGDGSWNGKPVEVQYREKMHPSEIAQAALEEIGE